MIIINQRDIQTAKNSTIGHLYLIIRYLSPWICKSECFFNMLCVNHLLIFFCLFQKIYTNNGCAVMKSSLIELLYSKFKYLVEVCWPGQNKADILYPHCVEDLVDILGQARENQTQELVDDY